MPGAWTDIVEIVAPSSAQAGQSVSIEARVKNIGGYSFYIAATGVYNSSGISFSPTSAYVNAGATQSFYGSFTMPSKKVRVKVISWYWTGSEWYQDDEAYIDIDLAEVFKGTISKKQLEYDESRASIPASNIPQGERGLVHIWGRNDMATTQRLGIHWLVYDPDGILVEDYEDWSLLAYRQGAEHEFIGGRFNLDKPGTYTINVALSMNPADPEIVDSYYGNLCTVAAVVPPPEVWAKLASRAITITPEVVEVVWQKLAERRVTITPEVVEWQKLASKTINISPEVGIPPEYVLIQETIYPWAYVFDGNGETCTFDFKLTPEQIPVYPWVGEAIVNSFVSELEKEGSRLLELRVYEDTTPMFWTNYRVEVTATASPIAWTLIIIAVLAILFVVAITFAIKAIESLIYHRKTLDEETKKTFARETLVAMILDLAPETPAETLEGMADQGLRDLLNDILAEVAPPISPWAILALAGGLGVLGVGAAVALGAAAKPGGTSSKGRVERHFSKPTWPRSTIPEPYQTLVRIELRKIPTWKLQEAYGKLKAGEATGIDLVERNRAYAISAIEDFMGEGQASTGVARARV